MDSGSDLALTLSMRVMTLFVGVMSLTRSLLHRLLLAERKFLEI